VEEVRRRRGRGEGEEASEARECIDIELKMDRAEKETLRERRENSWLDGGYNCDPCINILSLSLSLSFLLCPPCPALYPPLIDYELENAVIARAPSTITRDVLLIFSLHPPRRANQFAFYTRLDFCLGEIASLSLSLSLSLSFSVRLFVSACVRSPRRERE